MEAVALAVGIILMLVAAIGIVFYVALVIAIPVCRLLDWLFDDGTEQRAARPSRPAQVRKGMMKRIGEKANHVLEYCHLRSARR